MSVVDTPEAQEARWIAWKSRSRVADGIARKRMHFAFTVLFVAIAVQLAVVL